MGIFQFYNVRKPRQFEHKPIYYDPRKEALNRRVHKAKMELGVEETDYEQYKEDIRGSFVESTKHLRKSRDKGEDISSRLYKNMRLILVLVILAVLFWYFYLK
ncbi:MAG: hypothetical protein LBD53_01705 [Tannerella sp.]|jgi:hypothetical protein|nr:hypothetical protein [Tannerella sp.]